MIKQFTWIIAATTLAAALPAPAVQAATGVHDSITGLPMMYYYGSLCDLQRQGLPMSESAKTYLKLHPGDCARGEGTLPRGRKGRY